MKKLANLKKKLANKKGFTLVEMIIVMVIMALLAAALIPTMMGFIKDAKNNANLATARAYYVAAQSTATKLSATDTSVTNTEVTGAWTTLIEGLDGTCTVVMDDSATPVNGKIKSITYTPTSGKAVTINAGGTVTFAS